MLAETTAGVRLHRVFRSDRVTPWWFATRVEDDPAASGRFDLPAPLGTCYLGETAIAAALEAFQDFGEGLLPLVELEQRRRAEVVAPDESPRSASVVAESARAFGVTAALWAGTDRRLTQAWALALHRAGWRALRAGVQHDPSGRQRARVLFDMAGEHPPYDDADGWTATVHDLADDAGLIEELGVFGVRVVPGDFELPLVDGDAPEAVSPA